jgi:hypothetical protein
LKLTLLCKAGDSTTELLETKQKTKKQELSYAEFQEYVTICLEGLADVAAFYWLTSMVENNP